MSSYVEVYANLFRKVHRAASDAGIIHLRLNLPPEILKHFNVLSDSWTKLTSLNAFIVLATRIERDILPYETKPKAEENADFVKLTAAIKELRDTVQTKKEPEPKPSQAVEVVAAVSGFSNSRGANQYGNKRNYSDNFQSNQNYYKRRPQQANASNSDPSDQAELQHRYEEKHGKVPYPCRFCGAYHFHKHCPLQNINFGQTEFKATTCPNTTLHALTTEQP